MSSSIARIRAANIDGRAQNSHYIIDQLRRLNQVLVANAQEIQNVIAQDSAHTPAEIGVEYYLALTALKEHYTNTKPVEALEEEYSLAKGQEAPSRRIAAGIVYIVPAQYTLFYSTIAPLTAAIAAGNCVVLELETTLSAVSSLLRKLLPQALDADTFAVVERRPEDSFLKSCTQVWGAQLQQETITATQLASPSSARVVAVVDRSADIKKAASALVSARFSFGGRSPYAPDLVLVNEFVIQEFSNAVVEQATRYLARNTQQNGHAAKSETLRGSGASKLLADEKVMDGASVIVSGSNGTIVNAKKRTSQILSKKIGEPILVVHPVTSLDDAIDLATQSNETLLASYIFAAPTTAKYLSQFIDAYISITNQVPISLLVGPASPLHHEPNLPLRYTTSMFTVARPQLTSSSSLPIADTQLLAKALSTETGTSSVTAQLRTLATEPLPVAKRRDGKAIGFFEQGIITGLVTMLTVVVGGSGLLGYAAYKVVKGR